MLFFVARVTSYRRALGGNDASLLRRLFEFPRLLFGGVAELIGVLILVAIVTRKSKHEQLSCGRCALALFGMLAFLMLGSVRDGVPTHHAGRVLLPIWFFGVVILGSLSVPLVNAMSGPARALTGLAILGWTWLMTPFVLPKYDLAERALELEAGTAARGITDGALAIDTPDYGYFAVQAGFGSPIGTSVLDDHDPRHPSPSPFSSAQVLEQALRDRNAGFVIVTKAHAALLDPRCSRQWQNPSFVLFQCAPSHG
jgi:hypothetical protein